MIKPYYQNALATIYHADCRGVVPTLGDFDLLLTDPPYGIGEAAGKNKSRSKLAKAKDFGNLTWDNAPPAPWVIDMVRDAATRQAIFGGNYFNLPPSKCWLVWDKRNGASHFADCELVWTNFPMAVRQIRWRWAGMLQEDMKNKEIRHHPTQKPVPVVDWIIGLAEKKRPVGSIIDPFMGCGTALVAASRRGILSVGVEREEAYCEAAARRLEAELKGAA